MYHYHFMTTQYAGVHSHIVVIVSSPQFPRDQGGGPSYQTSILGHWEVRA